MGFGAFGGICRGVGVIIVLTIVDVAVGTGREESIATCSDSLVMVSVN